MYRARIKKWGFDKNNKHDEVLAILHEKFERDRIGKQSSFILRGRPVNMAEVERYNQRNRIALRHIMAARTERQKTPVDLECLTPEPPCRSLSDVSKSGNLERLGHSIRIFCEDCFQDGTRQLPAQLFSDLTGLLNLSRKHMGLDPKYSESIGALSLQAAFRWGISNTPLILDIAGELMCMLRWVSRLPLNHLILNMQQQLATITEQHLTPTDPLHTICVSLGQFNAEDTLPYFQEAYHLIITQFERFLGLTHMESLGNRLSWLVAENPEQGRPEKLQQIEWTVKTLTRCCNDMHGRIDPRTLLASLMNMHILRWMRRYSEVEIAALDLLDCLQSLPSKNFETRIEKQALDTLATCRFSESRRVREALQRYPTRHI